MSKTCKGCKHWKNQQRLINYYDSIGFCVNKDMNFNIEVGRLAGVTDTENLKDRSKVSGNCSRDFESNKMSGVKESRYIFTTDENFGCILHESK